MSWSEIELEAMLLQNRFTKPHSHAYTYNRYIFLKTYLWAFIYFYDINKICSKKFQLRQANPNKQKYKNDNNNLKQHTSCNIYSAKWNNTTYSTHTTHNRIYSNITINNKLNLITKQTDSVHHQEQFILP